MKIVIKATIAAASTMNAEHYQKQDTAESSHSGVVFTQSASQLTFAEKLLSAADKKATVYSVAFFYSG